MAFRLFKESINEVLNCFCWPVPVSESLLISPSVSSLPPGTMLTLSSPLDMHLLCLCVCPCRESWNSCVLILYLPGSEPCSDILVLQTGGNHLVRKILKKEYFEEAEVKMTLEQMQGFLRRDFIQNQSLEGVKGEANV